MTFDEVLDDARYKALVKRELETQIQTVLPRTVDGLAKKLWKGIPKEFLEFIRNHDTTYDYYESISSFIEEYFMEVDNDTISDKLANKILDWATNQKIIVFFPEKE